MRFRARSTFPNFGCRLRRAIFGRPLLRASALRGVARLESLNANGPNASLAASGSIDLKGEQPLQLDAAADMRLAALAGLVAPLESDGRFNWKRTSEAL